MTLDLEKEKKKNIKLAIGVAAIGFFCFFVSYILMFALMFLRPGLLFSLMPIPAMSKDIAGLNDKLYLISKEIDFKDLSFESAKPPKENVTLSILSGNKVSFLQDIKPFDSFSTDGSKIYFFSNGRYSAFDGSQWTEFKTSAIGKNPKGIPSPQGIWVLSEVKNNPELGLITDTETFMMTLPEGFTTDKVKCSGLKHLLWFQGRLYMFWSTDKALNWAAHDGKEWSASQSSEYQGRTKIASDDNTIYLFNEQPSEGMPSISLMTYSGGLWQEAKDLNIAGLHIDWAPLIHRGKPLLFVRGIFTEELYEIEDGNAVNPVKLETGFWGKKFFAKIGLFVLFGNLLFFLFIYLLSLLVGKFKMKTWEKDSKEYEFASLFRRFSAKVIDSVIIMAPVAALMIFIFSGTKSFEHPLRIILVALAAAAYLIFAGFLYHWLLEGIYGKTLGKKICGIVVLKDDFTKCGLLAGFLRNLMRIVDNFFYYLVGVVSMAGTLKWQRLGDMVAGTVVVREKKVKIS